MTAKARANTSYIKPITLTRLLCTNQTGAFPVTSKKGNCYDMMAYHFNTNAILACPLPSRSHLHLNKAFQSIYETLNDKGHCPMLR